MPVESPAPSKLGDQLSPPLSVLSLEHFREQFSAKLDEVVERQIQHFSQTIQDPFLQEIVIHVKKLSAGGKRLRPYVAYLGYLAGGGKDGIQIAKMGAALELFHVFCLIHDDIIDKAPTRRNTPTIEAFAIDRLMADQRRGDLRHLARGHAILVGDLVFSWAVRQAGNVAISAAGSSRVLEELYDMIDEVVAGQMIDVDTMTRDVHDITLLKKKMYMKTAGYSFVRPLRLGLQLSGTATEQSLQALTEIGTALGLAFQLQDDVLDIKSSEALLGKPTLSDIREGQQTFLTAFVARQGNAEHKALLQKVMHDEPTTEDVERLRDVLLHDGAVAEAEARIQSHLHQARQAIDRSPFESVVKNAFHELVALLEKRAR